MQYPSAEDRSARYWVAITMASVAGADLGDVCSHALGLGHVGGLPFYAAAFACLLAGARLIRVQTEAFYWAAIVVLRAAATNLADLATHDLRLADPWLIATLAVLLAAIVVPRRAAVAGQAPGTLPRTDARYWTAMLVAGTGGTALGDYCADQLGLGSSTLAWLAVWAVELGVMVRRAGRVGPAGVQMGGGPYWAVIVVVRTLGTNLGDWMAGREGIGLGLPVATGVSLVGLVALLATWRPRGR